RRPGAVERAGGPEKDSPPAPQLPLLALADAHLRAGRTEDGRALLRRHLDQLREGSLAVWEGEFVIYHDLDSLNKLYWQVRTVPLQARAGLQAEARAVCHKALELLRRAAGVQAAGGAGQQRGLGA